MLEIFHADLIEEEDRTVDEEVEGIFHDKEAFQQSRGLMTGILISSVIIIFLSMSGFSGASFSDSWDDSLSFVVPSRCFDSVR